MPECVNVRLRAQLAERDETISKTVIERNKLKAQLAEASFVVTQEGEWFVAKDGDRYGDKARAYLEKYK